jgi:hypothetical protein
MDDEKRERASLDKSAVLSREQQIIELYRKQKSNGKVSFQDLADEVGYASSGAAHNALMRALRRKMSDDVDEIRKDELTALEQAEAVVTETLQSTMGADISQLDIEVQAKIEDIRLKAVDRLMKIQDRRAKLLGLDSAIKHEHKVTTDQHAQETLDWLAQQGENSDTEADGL